MQLFIVCYIYVRVFFMVYTPLHTSILLYIVAYIIYVQNDSTENSIELET